LSTGEAPWSSRGKVSRLLAEMMRHPVPKRVSTETTGRKNLETVVRRFRLPPPADAARKVRYIARSPRLLRRALPTLQRFISHG